MHKTVFREFEKICRQRSLAGNILEVGATPDETSLLNMPCLAHAIKTGINLDGPFTLKDFTIVRGNTNDMACFKDSQFDGCLCNSVFEHDKYFWKTLSEMKRVARPGGLIVIGVPGFAEMPFDFVMRFAMTLKIHNFPRDYYRFSPQVFRDFFFEGMSEVEIRTVMLPPRIIGAGRKSCGVTL